MECNRDEAIRSRNIAEQRFLMHDLVGAKKFVLKARRLFPDLEGVPQLLAVLDVHIAAEEKVGGGDRNWYAILQTDAVADDATIKKQYRKLALVLHPDKNNAVGADGAFMLISEAWSVLSDKGKKAVHDAKRGKAPKSANGFSNFMNFGMPSPVQSKPASKFSSFDTMCPSCKQWLHCSMLHEINHILCTGCEQQLLASKTRKACEDSFCPPPASEAKARGDPVPCKTDNHYTNGSAGSPKTGHHNKRPKTGSDEKCDVNTQPGDEPQRYRGGQAHTRNTSWQYQQHPNNAFPSSKVPKMIPEKSPVDFQSHWGSHKSRTGSSNNVAATAKATADMVKSIYENVRHERVRAQNEARQNAMKERIEREIEAGRQYYKDRRKQKWKRKQEELKEQANMAQHAKKAFDRLFGRGQKPSTEGIRKATFEAKTDGNGACNEDLNCHAYHSGTDSHADVLIDRLEH